ncbi:hypothetical protein [uncultured Salinicola sp.]|uniref:hypothetical protein n=1 Tax=uncultured Salinicola sp. TaxID=1193542 RepID=UPI0026027BEE|nr:hypothetical protein [uncultured Salinicola sp.]|tara:strand:- start:124 stop:936 length:813 start_codon:yes stop_codon:yes gene_type:complete
MEVTPTPLAVNAIINEIQWRLRLHTMASPGPHRDMAQRYARTVSTTLGLTPIDRAEIRSDHPHLVEHTDTHGCAARNEAGDILLFSSRAAKGLAGKQRKAGIAYVRDLLRGGRPQMKDIYPGACALPIHVRSYIERHGLAPDAIEILNTLLQRVEFRHGGAAFKFSTRWERSIRKRIDRDDGKAEKHLIHSPDPAHRITDRVQVTLTGKPRVRLTKHGISVGQGLPEVVRLGLIGKSMDTLIDLPGLSDMVIHTVSAYSDTITQVQVKIR